MKLVIDISAADRTNSLVASITNPTPVGIVQTLVLGDAEPLDITFTDSLQTPAAAPSWAGATGYVVIVGLGTLDANALLSYTATTSFASQTAGWIGRIDLSTEALKQAVIMGNSPNGWAGIATDPRTRNARPSVVWFWMQVQVVDPSGNPVSYSVFRVPVLNRVLPKNATTTQSSADPVYAWLLANAVLNAGSVTALVGGSSTCLDGYDDTSLPTGCTILLTYNNVTQTWKLESSTATTDVTATPARVRAKNYSTTNRVWFQVG